MPLFHVAIDEVVAEVSPASSYMQLNCFIDLPD